MRISDWSSDVCSSDLEQVAEQHRIFATGEGVAVVEAQAVRRQAPEVDQHVGGVRVVDLGTVGEALGFDEASGDQPVRDAVGEDLLHRAEHGGGAAPLLRCQDRKNGWLGNSVCGRVDLGDRSTNKKK